MIKRRGGLPRPVSLEYEALRVLGFGAFIGPLELAMKDCEDRFLRKHALRRELMDVDVVANALEDCIGDGLILVVKLLLHVREEILIVGDVGFEELVNLIAVRNLECDHLVDATGANEG